MNALILTACVVATPPGPAEANGRAFLAAHCVACHGADKQSGDVRLDDLPADPARAAARWAAVRDQVRDGLMPPAKRPRPDAAEARRVVAWATERLAERPPPLPNQGNLVPHELLFGPAPAAAAPPPPRVWRLSPDGYKGWMSDLYRGRLPQLTQPFTLVPERGIRDFAGLYSIDEATTDVLVRNAAAIVEYQCGATARGVRTEPVTEFAKLMDPNAKPTRAQLESAVQTQFRLAVGRPATPDEVARFVKLYVSCAEDGDHPAAVRTMLQGVLLKTDAMYRSEQGAGPGARRMLAPDELARAVALALGERRDDALAAAARNGELKTREQVTPHVKRLLDDPARSPRVLQFFREYFEYDKAPDVFKTSPKGYAAYQPGVLVGDTAALIRHIVAADKDVFRELLTTPTSFVNLRMAEVKGMRGVYEPTPAHVAQYRADKGEKKPFDVNDLYGLAAFPKQQPVTLPAGTRLGVLMQPSWLASWSGNFDNDPVRRGRWVRERLLGGTVPDLPIGVDAQVPDDPHRTYRERLTVTRAGRCWTCHRQMDELGLPFEQFDHFGRLRTAERVQDADAAKNVDKKGKPPGPVFKDAPLVTTGVIANSGDPKLDGPVKDPYELVRKLADSDRCRQVFVRHAFRFFLGRNESLADARALQEADRAYVAGGGSFKALVASLLTSDSFLYRSAPTPGDRK